MEKCAGCVILNCKGALAQLGARNIRIVKATGSIPVCSIFVCKKTQAETAVDTKSVRDPVFTAVFCWNSFYQYSIEILKFY